MSYATLKAWSAGVRTPSAENLRQIADAAEQTGRAAEERSRRSCARGKEPKVKQRGRTALLLGRADGMTRSGH